MTNSFFWYIVAVMTIVHKSKIIIVYLILLQNRYYNWFFLGHQWNIIKNIINYVTKQLMTNYVKIINLQKQRLSIGLKIIIFKIII